MSNDDQAQDGTYEACLSYLAAKGYVLWGDYSLNPNANDDGTPKNRPAALWLEAQVRGVADHYDTPARTYHPTPNKYSGPHSTETTGGGQRPRWYESGETTGGGLTQKAVNPDSFRDRPSALITHGQQAEAW